MAARPAQAFLPEAIDDDQNDNSCSREDIRRQNLRRDRRQNRSGLNDIIGIKHVQDRAGKIRYRAAVVGGQNSIRPMRGSREPMLEL